MFLILRFYTIMIHISLVMQNTPMPLTSRKGGVASKGRTTPFWGRKLTQTGRFYQIFNRLSKRPGSVWICLWGHALKRYPGINRKSRVSYLCPGFLSSATWPSLTKKHYNGLNHKKTQIFNTRRFFHRDRDW